MRGGQYDISKFTLAILFGEILGLIPTQSISGGLKDQIFFTRFGTDQKYVECLMKGSIQQTEET